ncbi:response regulator [Sporomusa malonica]|uniref:Two-component system, chemotaxis family, response regulator CheY n=1 Tax=Sporomusa malonica TaxID=112901 RepID=A0A1W2EGK9_9FIRM|nr:response regulator [Sporomusa malonica]SMD08864.1 two-component system, chemotaxis family, response regulator CheY [Sporomusa malonica]
MRVLVVDDSKISRELIMSYLREIGVDKIDEAADGFEAISRIKKLPPDTRYEVITLDVVMPRKDGLEALKDIKILSPKSKIIICSSNRDTHSVTVAMGFGVDGYVLKPFTKQKLLDALWRSLKIENK